MRVVGPDDPSRHGVTTAMPVRLEVAGRHADAVRRWTEGVLGWQPVEADPSGPVPPAVRIVDLAGAERRGQDGRVADASGADASGDDGRGEPARPGPLTAACEQARPSGTAERAAPPTVLLVADDDDAAAVGRLVQRLGPDLVLGWPAARDDLADRVSAVLTRATNPATSMTSLRIGGAAGGVGTSTLVLALAGLTGWSRQATLAVVRPRCPATGVRHVSPDAVAASDLWQRATPLAGVTATRAVCITGGVAPLAPTDPRIQATVVDAGVEVDVDVLVCRPDGAALDRIAATTAAAIVLVGDGPLRPVQLAEVTRGRIAVQLPWSARVARAGLLGRVPGSLPGSFLRPLTALVPVAGGEHRPTGAGHGRAPPATRPR
jgi:hypothetical protein